MRVLIIEDDPIIADVIRKGLSEAGYNTEVISDGQDALDFASTEKFDLLIVDVMLPKVDGLTLVEKLRGQKNETPVLFLSAKRSVEDRVEGFKRGGDDYMVKPFSFSELLVRCNAILRRSTHQTDSRRLNFLDLEIDLLSRTVTRGKKKIELHQKEFALLEYLMRNPEQVLTKTQILEAIWKYSFDPQTNVVDVLVCRLRNKVDRDFQMKIIKTIRGVGYVLRSS